MIVTKTIPHTWSTRNKKHWEKKGYIFTNYGDVFDVKIEDVGGRTHHIVEFKCGVCEKIEHLPLCNYTAKRMKDRCSECAKRENADIQKVRFNKMCQKQNKLWEYRRMERKSLGLYNEGN